MSRHIIKSFVNDAAKLRIVLHANFESDLLIGYSVRTLSNFEVNNQLDSDHDEEVEHFLLSRDVGMYQAYEQADARFREIVLPLI